MEQAISNVETVWNEEQLKKEPRTIPKYDDFVDEFILGVDISIFQFESLVAKRDLL